MPFTTKGKEIMSAMKKEYGDKKGEQVFYASKNKGTISGVEGKNPARHRALEKKKLSLNQMHKTSSKKFESMDKGDQEDFAKRDRDQSRALMIKKLEAAGDYESAQMLKGN